MVTAASRKRSPNLRIRLPKRITVSWLRRMRACESGIERFAFAFPGGCDATKENLVVAMNERLNYMWLLDRVLTKDALYLFLRKFHRIGDRYYDKAIAINANKRTSIETKNALLDAARQRRTQSIVRLIMKMVSEPAE